MTNYGLFNTNKENKRKANIKPGRISLDLFNVSFSSINRWENKK